ncbi:hypothetical protein [Stenotrophomonas sp.]|uniref:hypothetical protein n=1 Tax=Stenotrophomonas sp. TaxID=69392 RepID=UPI0028A8586F|nr:hypothetical protein [Stenotrophomonas sp.]
MSVSEPKPDEALARAIFTAAAAQAIAGEPSGADFEGMAAYAFKAARAYASAQKANKPPSISAMAARGAMVRRRP